MIKVIRNKVLVEPLHNDDKDTYSTSSGLLIKSSQRPKGRLVRAKVLGIGSHVRYGNTLVPMTDIVNVGDTIMYYMPSAQKLEHDGEEYTIIRTEDIEIVLEGGEN